MKLDLVEVLQVSLLYFLQFRFSLLILFMLSDLELI